MLIVAILILAIGLGIKFGLKKDCPPGYNGNSCENCLCFYDKLEKVDIFKNNFKKFILNRLCLLE